jgi:YhcG PDDEXK nuclease domain
VLGIRLRGLKSGELTHQDSGQMDMYVRMTDGIRRGPDDNPTVGIILCTHKDASVVRYSVLDENEQLFATKSQTGGISRESFLR